MPLRSGRSRDVISGNIREFHHGGTYARTAAKFGKGTADRQAVAVAMSKAGLSRGKKKRKRRRGVGRKLLRAIDGAAR